EVPVTEMRPGWFRGWHVATRSGQGLGGTGCRACRQICCYMVQQIVHAPAVLGGNGENVPDSQAMELRGQRHMLRVIDLVYSKAQRLARGAQQMSEFFIERHDTRAAIHHKHEVHGLVDRHLGLAEYLVGHHLTVRGDDAARIDNVERLTLPLRRGIDPVTGHTRLIAHQGSPPAADPVEKRGLADVGPTENRDAGKLDHRLQSGFSSSMLFFSWNKAKGKVK